MAQVSRIAGNLGAWTAYTPTWTQGATISKTVAYARYTQIGKLVAVQAHLAATSAGTATQMVTVTLPVPAKNFSGSYSVLGDAAFTDSSPYTCYSLIGYATNTNQALFIGDTTAANNFGTVPAITIASGDLFSFSFSYEAA